jgi:hypothetical protein
MCAWREGEFCEAGGQYKITGGASLAFFEKNQRNLNFSKILFFILF